MFDGKPDSSIHDLGSMELTVSDNKDNVEDESADGSDQFLDELRGAAKNLIQSAVTMDKAFGITILQIVSDGQVDSKDSEAIAKIIDENQYLWNFVGLVSALLMTMSMPQALIGKPR